MQISRVPLRFSLHLCFWQNAGCQGQSLLVNRTHGLLLSRNYPLQHHGSGDCRWLIKSNSNRDQETAFRQVVSLSFEDFTTSAQDKLYVFNGIGSSRTLQGGLR